MYIIAPAEFIILILFKRNTPLLMFLKGNIRNFGIKIIVTGPEIFHLTYLKRLYSVKNRIRDICTLLA